MTKPQKERLKARNLSMLKHYRKKALTGIKKIRPRLHRIIFFWKKSPKKLIKKIGPLNVKPNRFPKRMRYYWKMAYLNFHGMKLHIFLKPKDNTYVPNYRIETTFKKSLKHQRALMRLAQKLPNLEISSIEYAVDFLCKSPSHAECLFFIIRRYMYFPSQPGTSRSLGDKIIEPGGPRKENTVLKIGKVTKIYERGPDKKEQWKFDKKGNKVGFWLHEDVDRVRLEFKRDIKHPGKEALGSLKDFVEHPDFEAYAYERFEFKVFHNSKKLPKEWEEYIAKDKEGNIISYNCFHDIYRHGIPMGLNMSNCTKAAAEFADLMETLRLRMEEFDEKWEKRAKRFSSRKSHGQPSRI